MAADKPRRGQHSYAFGQASGPADAGPAVLATVGCDPSAKPHKSVATVNTRTLDNLNQTLITLAPAITESRSSSLGEPGRPPRFFASRSVYLAPFDMPGSEVEELHHPLFLSDSWSSARLLLTNKLICWASRAGWSIGTRV